MRAHADLVRLLRHCHRRADSQNSSPSHVLTAFLDLFRNHYSLVLRRHFAVGILQHHPCLLYTSRCV